LFKEEALFGLMLSDFSDERINIAMTGFCWQLMEFAMARFFGYLIKFLGRGGRSVVCVL
jgi:hypothetical protein